MQFHPQRQEERPRERLGTRTTDIDPELGLEEVTTLCAVAARPNCLAQDRPALPDVRHHESVLKDVLAGRSRLEEHEESDLIPRWKATSWVSL